MIVAIMQMHDLQSINKRYNYFRNNQENCDCMPLCTDLTYDVETSQTDWNWKKQKMANREHFSTDKCV